MEANLFRDPNGYFPADVMVYIANYTCVRTVTSILLSSKYWNKIMDPLLEHPPITILTRSESFLTRTLHHFRRGRGFMLWSKDIEQGVYPRERRQDSNVFIGYFRSLIQMRQFLDNLKNVFTMTDPNPEDLNNYNDEYYIIMGTNMDNIQFFDLHAPSIADPAEILCAKYRNQKIRELLRTAGYINTDHNHYGREHIYISIAHQMKKYDQELDMTILADGDVICQTHGKVFRSYRVRTSKKLFANLLKIIKYSKHKRKMENKSGMNDLTMIYLFDLAYEPSLDCDDEVEHYSSDSNDEYENKKPLNGYYIQHEVRRNLETNRSAIETNLYKTGALEKVVKLLEDTLFNPKSKGPTLLKEKRLILPPQSKGNALFDSVRFDPKLRSVGIPNIVAIVMSIEEYKRHFTDKYIIAIDGQRSLDSLKATIELFFRVEEAMDSAKQEKIREIKYVLNSNYRIVSEIQIYTHSPVPIVEIPKSILDPIATYLLKFFPRLNDTESNQ